MAISRERKAEIVEDYKALLAKSNGLILASYAGLSVKDVEGLRGQIRDLDGEFHIVKNRLMKIASEEAGVALPEGSFDGTTAIAFATEDMPGVAKAIVDLSKTAEGLEIKGGVFEGELFDQGQIKKLADLPPLPVLRSQLMAMLNSPPAGIAGALASSVRQIVDVLNAYSQSEAPPTAGPAAAVESGRYAASGVGSAGAVRNSRRNCSWLRRK